MRFDWPVRSSDMSTVANVLDIFGQIVRRIILAPRNIQALDAALQKESTSGDPVELSGVCDADVSPNLPLTGAILATESNRIFENTTFKAIMIISCTFKDIAFQVMKTNSLFMCSVSKEAIVCRHFFCARAFDSQIELNSESPKLSHGGPSHASTSIRHQPTDESFRPGS